MPPIVTPRQRSAASGHRRGRWLVRTRCRPLETAIASRQTSSRSGAERVGVGIASAINTFDPEEVVIGGGAALAGELLLKPATRVARDYVPPGVGMRTVIRLARHGVRAGALGAAPLAMHELEGPHQNGARGFLTYH
jgi:predicted NBD/HSP70 family sugar kinase